MTPDGLPSGRIVHLQLKLLVSFTLLFSLVFGAMFWWAYRFADQQAVGAIRTQLFDVAQGAATGIDGDMVVELARTGQPNPQGTTDDPRYNQLMDWLATVQAIAPQSWPYIYVPGDAPDQIVGVADLWERSNPDKAVPFGLRYEDELAYRGLREHYVATDERGNLEVSPDQWGTWVSAFAPITNDAGQPVAGVGIDMEAQYVNAVRQQVLREMGIAGALAYSVLFLIIVVATRAAVRPIVALTATARLLGDGVYRPEAYQRRPRRFPDELDLLMATFLQMAGQVYQREQSLQDQVQALKIVIDEAKGQKQVDAIAGTDFFQQLQTKAQQLRARRQDLVEPATPDPTGAHDG